MDVTLLQEMVDHYAITKTLNEYCHGCDRLDQLHMASVYLEDSWDDHGNYKCPGREFAELITNALSTNSKVCSHQLGQSLIKVNGDEAGAETYFIASLLRPAADGGETLHQMGGRYIDTLHRENGAWKIRKRICVRDWSINHAVREDWLREQAFVQGTRSGDDPSFAALQIPHSGLPARE